MKNLIEALMILAKYGNPSYPTSCEHDMMFVHINPMDVSKEDLDKLTELGFHMDSSLGNFYSYRYGSA